nr:Chain A, MSP-1 peptide [Plasmodium falciparum]
GYSLFQKEKMVLNEGTSGTA